jgi:UPF0176 protein
VPTFTKSIYSMQLYNKVDKKILEQQLELSNIPRTTISFYKYHHLQEPQIFRDELFANLSQMDVLGRIYVAYEGINGQISVPTALIEQFKQRLYSYNFLNGIRLNYAIEDDGKSFIKLKILVRKKIVADGLDDDSFNVSNSGIHLNAIEFNEIISKENTILVDMRNHYESEVGHFENAITPDVDTFRDSLPIIVDQLKENKEKDLVMYCTGGIRCEKASAWMKHNGFQNVYQLNGGIIEYARQVNELGLENKFLGKNFVFDKRLGEKIGHEIISKCHQCGEPSDTHTNCANLACHLLFIQCAKCADKFKGCCCDSCTEISLLPEEKQKELRKGFDPGRKVFKKGKGPQLLFKQQ